MRRILAVLVDVVVIALGGYLLFRLAETITPCGIRGTCPFLAPLTVLFLLVLLVAYFGAGYVLWRRTPGERLFLG